MVMRKIKDLNGVEDGDWILIKPEKEDGRKTIIIMKNETFNVFLYNVYGKVIKLTKEDITKGSLSSIENFYEDWNKYKLNKKEKIKQNKELILDRL